MNGGGGGGGGEGASSLSQDPSNGHNWNNIDTNVTKTKSFYSLFFLLSKWPCSPPSSATLSCKLPPSSLHHGSFTISPMLFFFLPFSFSFILCWREKFLTAASSPSFLLFVSFVFFYFPFHYSINGSCTGAFPQSEVPPKGHWGSASQDLHKIYIKFA